MGVGGVWGPYNQGKSWKGELYPSGKEVRKYFHNLKAQ
jgi:hypothetical protein